MAKDGIVAVTGASGFAAGEIIRQLIARGYTVRGTVRSLKNEEKVQHLRDTFPGLTLFEADLMGEGSFDECFKGVSYVMHTASPFQLSVEDPQRDLIDPACLGTLNVLRAARKAGVKRVVLTSSAAAIASQGVPPADKVWTEEDWNTDSTLTDGPYRLSKSKAERAAWDFVEGKIDAGTGPELRTICPTFILGPPLSKRTDATSVKFAKGLLDGSTKKVNPACVGAVDVRDVARAHIEALERDNVSGRFLMSSAEGLSQLELADMLRADFAAYPLPTEATGDFKYRPKYSTAKAERELGITLTPISTSMVDMAKALVELGIVERK